MSTSPGGASAFVARAAVKRRARIGDGVLGVIGAVFVGWMATGFASWLLRRLSLFHQGSEVYRTAEWASTTSIASFTFVAGSLAAWLLARSLRAFFGLPVRVVPDWVRGLATLRAFAALIVLGWIGLWSIDEILLRTTASAPLISLLLGLAMCAQLTWDAPRLLRDGRAALEARLPILRVPLQPLATLAAPEPGRLVRTRGRVVAGAGEGEPFRIEDEGAQAVVDPTAGPFVSEAEAAGVEAGARVEVLGEIVGGGDAYRGGIPTIRARRAGPKPQPLMLFGEGGSMARRLVVAGAVELVCAALLASMPLGLTGTWLYLRHVAQPSVHKLPLDEELIIDGPAPGDRRRHQYRRVDEAEE